MIDSSNVPGDSAELALNEPLLLSGFRGRGGGGPNFDVKGGDWPCPNRCVCVMRICTAPIDVMYKQVCYLKKWYRKLIDWTKFSCFSFSALAAT